MRQEVIGFPEFRTAALATLEPMMAAARTFLQIGQEMLSAPASEQLPDLAKQITRSAANSMKSVLLLVSNGCGVDGLKVARTMFEAAVTLHYLDSHPELVQDFVDYLWVIRKKHHEYLLSLPPAQSPPLAAERIAEMETNFERIKHRFMDRKGRIRNSWCKANLREMSKDINAESMYGGLYPFGSSMTHTDILAVVAGAGGSDDVEPVPSTANVMLALQTGVVSFAMTLTVYDKVSDLGYSDKLEVAFNQFKSATPNATPTKAIPENEIAVCAYYLWERRGRPFGSPDVDWFEAERQMKTGYRPKRA